MAPLYYFNGNLRWSLLWDNPNCWAAFLACLLAWVWLAQAQASLRLTFKFQVGKPCGWLSVLGLLTLYVAEAGVWFLLVKTYSRGGLVAAVAAMGFFFALRLGSTRVPRVLAGVPPDSGFGRDAQTSTRDACAPRKSVLRKTAPLLARVAVIAVLCSVVGFASRMSPGFVAQDKSVLNRVDQWKSALVMIGDSPFEGWGYKLSGMVYQNWYQPLSHTTRPTGFVNSYLEVAVEQGSFVLFLVVVCACALLLTVWRLRRAGWVVAAGACLVAWLVCNLWSSLWVWSGLWILPGAATVCIMVAAWFLNPKSQIPNPKGRDEVASADLAVCVTGRDEGASSGCKPMLRVLAVSLVVGIVVWAGVVGAGIVLARDVPFQARPAAGGDAAIVTRRGEREGATESHTEIWVDSAVTGRYWGKSIRTILEDDSCRQFVVYAPWARRDGRLAGVTSRCIYSGFQAEVLSDKDMDCSRASVIILHPTVYPPAIGLAKERCTEIMVCLPEVDVSAYNLPWRRWAKENGATLVFSPQGATRIDPEQNKEFWRTLLFNADYSGCKKHGLDEEGHF